MFTCFAEHLKCILQIQYNSETSTRTKSSGNPVVYSSSPPCVMTVPDNDCHCTPFSYVLSLSDKAGVVDYIYSCPSIQAT